MGMNMISRARLLVLGLAASGALLLTTGVSVPPASAQNACKADVVTAAGQGGRFGIRAETRAKELEGKGKAMRDAVTAWERDVSSRFGDDWGSWEDATDKSFRCEPTQKLIGGIIKVGCTISGRPCQVVGRARKTADPERRAERQDAGDDSGRYDDDDKDNGRGSPAYRRMMRFQDRLAEERQRWEDWGWKRENRRQSWLKEARKRAEMRQVEWEMLRQRYHRAHRRWAEDWWGWSGYSWGGHHRHWGSGRWSRSWDYASWHGRRDYDRWDPSWEYDYLRWQWGWVDRALHPE
jgi:hypothetical protein